MRFRAMDVRAATDGVLVGGDVAIDGVSFDSRSIAAGQLFVPIVANRDGHDFVASAIDRGAAAYLTSRGVIDPRVPAIQVDDTAHALMSLATGLRSRVLGPVVGITGSVGKTSTKDLAIAAVAATRRAWASEKSFNNEQGLPTTIVNAPDDTDVLILEMGMRGHGEITKLCDIAHPTVGVVTRVAEAHSDRVGGIDGVERAKGELVEALPASGTAILNADDERVMRMRQRARCAVLTFGTTSAADVVIDDLVVDDVARASFAVRTPWGTHRVRLGVSGRHMAINAAAALAVAGVAGADVGAAAAALATAGLSAMRMQVRHARSGAVVLDDSYNANPTSVRAALDALVDLPAKRRIAVLGVMAEISDVEAEHRGVYEYARQRGVEVIAAGTTLYGVSPADDVLEALGSVADGDVVLVKGSRVAGLDAVANALVD